MIEKIKYILDLNKFNLNRIFVHLGEHGIIFTPTNQKFRDIFSCKIKTGNMILIISTNYIHQHEADNPNNPTLGSYVMCCILIPRPPHLLLTFSSTNQNCLLGIQYIKPGWGVNKTTTHTRKFSAYIKDNMYQKMDPIKKSDGNTVGPSNQRNVNLTRAYIIDGSPDAYLPEANPVQS